MVVVNLNHSYMDIGQRVKTYRLNRGLSQDELSEGICSRQTISLLENGQHLPSAEFMKKIAVKLGVSLHEIMVDQVNELEAKVQLDIIKVYVEMNDYANAFPLIEELDGREDLLEYQRRELVLCRAECLLRTGKVEEAIEFLTDLQQRLELERETDDHFMATLYDKLGTAYYFLSSIANAHAYYMRAYQLTLRFSERDLTAARISYNLGMVCRQLNRQMDSIEYLSKAEFFFKGISDSKTLAHVLFELGIAYRFRMDFERADEYLKESLALYRSLNIVSMAREVRQTHAFIVLAEKHPDESIKELLNCAFDHEKANDTVRLVYTNACIAFLQLKQKRYAEANIHLQKARNLITEDEAEKYPEFAYLYHVNAYYCLEISDFKRCVELAYQSANTFDKMGLEWDAAEALKLSAHAYRKQSMFEQADRVSQKIIELISRSQAHSISRLGASS